MRHQRSWCLAASLVFVVPSETRAQERHAYQTDFTVEVCAARRAEIYDAVSPQGIAVVQGASWVTGFGVFRQSNVLYYLGGVESEHA